MPDQRQQFDQPMLAAHFTVTVGDREIAMSSVSELHDVLKDVQDEQYRRSVILRRAITGDRFLYRWYRDTRLGKDTVSDVTIRLLSAPGGKPVNSWVLEKAVPMRWTGPEFDALGSELAMEELQLQYESINWLEP